MLRVSLLAMSVCISLFAKAPQDKMAHIISFPRSGNTWTRYCIEYCSKRPTRSPLADLRIRPHLGNVPIGVSIKLDTDLSKPPVVKAHTPEIMKLEDPDLSQDNLLILVVRDFRECLKRHFGSATSIKSFIKNENRTMPKYFELIRIYKAWPENHRLLVYYEDLHTNLEQELRRICSFLGESQQHIPSFIQDIEEHKKDCANFYRTLIGRTTSFKKPDELHYHANRSSAKTLKELRSLVEECHPDCLDVIQRYLTD